MTSNTTLPVTDALDLTLRIARAICGGAMLRAKDGPQLISGPIPIHEHVLVSDDGKTVTLVDFVKGPDGAWYSLILPVEQVAAYMNGELDPNKWVSLATLPGVQPVVVSQPVERLERCLQ